MKTPTTKEITTELATLKEMAPRIRQQDTFGNDNRVFIEAQIEVIDDLMSEEEVYDKEESGDWDGDTISHAMDAVQWLTGESEDGPPSEGWKPLLPK